MKEKKTLDDIKRGGYAALADGEGSAADGFEDATPGDGRNAKHGILSVLLVDDDGDQWMVPYHAVVKGKGRWNGIEFVFRCVLDEVVHEVTVKGPQIQYAVERFAAGMRATWHTRGSGTTSIRVVEVKAPPKAG